VAEAIGITQAARQAGLPVVISFTVETDGRLPTGETIEAAITAVDDATESYASYFMINCAHPTHFADALVPGAGWAARIGGLRANASRLSHAELDACEELDTGNPAELGQQYRDLRAAFPNIKVVGGCCGTSDVHVGAISAACLPSAG
jgi:S-methylmethionine-dependent homocysteine/selenocysteine methylase